MPRKAEHGRKQSFELGHRSVLWMKGSTQQPWQPCLPKTHRPVGTRINLTFQAMGCGMSLGQG
jgi:alkylated DNA repair dioxygenase AlkB